MNLNHGVRKVLYIQLACSECDETVCIRVDLDEYPKFRDEPLPSGFNALVFVNGVRDEKGEIDSKAFNYWKGDIKMVYDDDENTIICDECFRKKHPKERTETKDPLPF